MGCSGCRKKTYYERAKDVDKKTSIAFTIGIIILGLALYGLITLIVKL